jgi:hypothetical protein
MVINQALRKEDNAVLTELVHYEQGLRPEQGMPLHVKRMKLDPFLANEDVQAGSKYALDYDSCVSKEPEIATKERPRLLHRIGRNSILEGRQRSPSKDAADIKRLQNELQKLRKERNRGSLKEIE